MPNTHRVLISRELNAKILEDDPLGRTRAGPRARELLNAYCSGQLVWVNGLGTDPERKRESLTKPKPKPKPKPFTAPYHVLRQPRTRSHWGGACWTFSQDRIIKTSEDARGLPIKAILLEHDDTTARYEWWFDIEMLEPVQEEGGKIYYLLDTWKWNGRRDQRIRRL